ncbi:MAG: hypothetical protein ACXVGC_10200 [Mycobacteriaceae bacterium]
MNRYEAEYLARLAAKAAFGATLMGHATVRRRVRKVRERWLP